MGGAGATAAPASPFSAALEATITREP
jgi:hypothetical protein